MNTELFINTTIGFSENLFLVNYYLMLATTILGSYYHLLVNIIYNI